MNQVTLDASVEYSMPFCEVWLSCRRVAHLRIRMVYVANRIHRYSLGYRMRRTKQASMRHAVPCQQQGIYLGATYSKSPGVQTVSKDDWLLVCVPPLLRPAAMFRGKQAQFTFRICIRREAQPHPQTRTESEAGYVRRTVFSLQGTLHALMKRQHVSSSVSRE